MNSLYSVFEVLNKKFLTLNKFTKEVTIELGNILFDSKNNPQNALDVGFKQIDVDLIAETDDLSLAEMKEYFVDAIEDFSLSGGFDNSFKSAVCEKTFSFSLPQLPKVVFDGRIDAIVQENSGNYIVVDVVKLHAKLKSLCKKWKQQWLVN